MEQSTSTPIADRIVRRAARGLTRRRFMRNLGAGALGLSLGAALGDLKLAKTAQAHGTWRHPCGPSPICPHNRCYAGHCRNSAGRLYNHFSCVSYRYRDYMCWTEDYRNRGRGRWRCCDCCSLSGGHLRCSSCPGGDHMRRRACICRKRTG